MTASPRTLVLGWGNPARGDDGLGPALVDLLAGSQECGAAEQLTVESDYQLQIEDAAELARHDRVVFVDADRRGEEPFSCRRLGPAEGGLSFTSHSVSPGALLALARDLFGRQPEAWMVGIRGYRFGGFDEGLSPEAEANLGRAAEFLRCALRQGSFAEVPSSGRHESRRVGCLTDREGIP